MIGMENVTRLKASDAEELHCAYFVKYMYILMKSDGS